MDAHFDRVIRPHGRQTRASMSGPRSLVLSAAALLIAGCVGSASPGSTCRTSEATLASLRDGMSYRDVVRLIGCEGTIDQPGTLMVARWSGPGESAFAATLVTFRNDRMVAFAVNGQ